MRFEIATFENFSEDKYLLSNSDVSEAINRGEFKSGFDHFRLCGNLEDRYQKVTLQRDAPLAIVHIPKCAGTSLRSEIEFIRPSMYSGPKYAVEKDNFNLFKLHSREFEEKRKSQSWSLRELHNAFNHYEVVIGHISLKHFWQAGFRDFVGVVREPRIRLLSEWRFLSQIPEYRENLIKDGRLDIRSYFLGNQKTKSLSDYVSPEIIFDSNIRPLNLSFYWHDEIPRLLLEWFGRKCNNVRGNETMVKKQNIDYLVLDLIHSATEMDSNALNRLKSARLLSSRSDEQLEDEFQQYLEKHFKYVRRLL